MQLSHFTFVDVTTINSQLACIPGSVQHKVISKCLTVFLIVVVMIMTSFDTAVMKCV